MNCDIIRDLLPSYMDKLCSESSKKEVVAHLETCEQCNRILNAMNQPIQTPNQADVLKAKQPFKRIQKQKLLQIIVAILATILLMISAVFVVQDVAVVHDLFFPRVFQTIAPSTEQDSSQWRQVTFCEFDGTPTSDYLELNNIFFDGSIVSHANNEEPLSFRIKDLEGTILIDTFEIESATAYQTQGLKLFTPYILEMKNPSKTVVITIT